MSDARAEGSYEEARLESLPDALAASLEVRDAWRERLAAESAGLEFIVSDLAKWTPAQTVKVDLQAPIGDDRAFLEQIMLAADGTGPAEWVSV